MNGWKICEVRGNRTGTSLLRTQKYTSNSCASGVFGDKATNYVLVADVC
jgi:hypothetical protein